MPEKKSQEPQQVILARIEEGFPVVAGRVALTPKLIAKTVLWRHRGSASDMKKAKKYADEEGWSVFFYPLSVKDARVRAAREVLDRSKK